MPYGYDPDQLTSLIGRPQAAPDEQESFTELVVTDRYALRRVVLAPGDLGELRGRSIAGETLYVETGCMAMTLSDAAGGNRRLELPADRLVSLPVGVEYRLEATASSTAYLFAPSSDPAPLESIQAVRPFDIRQKYWGDIRTIVSGEVTGKRLFLKEGCSGSMEFHVQKHESYYVHSGELALLLRAGRAENRLFRIPAGTVVQIPQGLMHQRGALSDTVIIEISTRDSDADSFLVEDGTKRPMEGFQELLERRRRDCAAAQSGGKPLQEIPGVAPLLRPENQKSRGEILSQSQRIG